MAAVDPSDFGYYAPHHPLLEPWMAGILIVALLAVAFVLLRDV